jgi:hypothetical protein
MVDPLIDPRNPVYPARARDNDRRREVTGNTFNTGNAAQYGDLTLLVLSGHERKERDQARSSNHSRRSRNAAA